MSGITNNSTPQKNNLSVNKKDISKRKNNKKELLIRVVDEYKKMSSKTEQLLSETRESREKLEAALLQYETSAAETKAELDKMHAASNRTLQQMSDKLDQLSERVKKMNDKVD